MICPPPAIEAPHLDEYPDFATWLEARDHFADALSARAIQVDLCHGLDLAERDRALDLALAERDHWRSTARRRAPWAWVGAGVALGFAGGLVVMR